jgi:hypothetical protein
VFLQTQPPPGANNEMLYSSDGVLRFARLIARGLARSSLRFRSMSMGPGSPFSEAYVVELTERGKMLLSAWSEGDEDKYRLMLDQASP